MKLPTPPIRGNKLLSALPPAEMARLHPLLTRVRWTNGQGLYEAGERIGHVFFVEQGFVSMAAQADGANDGVGVGLIGREGMVGYPVLLSPEAASYSQATVQVPGGALRMPAQALRDHLGALPVLRRLLFGALEVSMAQVVQTAACNGRHSLPQRLARWLLMAHERVDGDELALTQQVLATVLGVRRSGVAGAVASLRTAGLVRQRRARVTVCDRPGLEAAACGCHGRVQAFAAAVAARTPDPADSDPADLAA